MTSVWPRLTVRRLPGLRPAYALWVCDRWVRVPERTLYSQTRLRGWCLVWIKCVPVKLTRLQYIGYVNNLTASAVGVTRQRVMAERQCGAWARSC